MTEQFPTPSQSLDQEFRDWILTISGETMHGPSFKEVFIAGSKVWYPYIRHLEQQLQELTPSPAMGVDRDSGAIEVRG